MGNRLLRGLTGFVSVLMVCLLIGCQQHRVHNPSFAIEVSDAHQALAQMYSERRPLARPVVVLGGWIDDKSEADFLAANLQSVTTTPQWVLPIYYDKADSFTDIRERIIAAVDEAFPSEDPDWTTEVDVVGYSMGGLVGRYAGQRQSRKPGARTLRINRLFTIATPHRGAEMARLPAVNGLQADMRSGSAFLASLHESGQRDRFAVFAYVRLGDFIVGEQNAAPEDSPLWWVSNRPFEDAHMGAYRDPRLLADIGRHLRYEPTYGQWPAAPLPGAAHP